MRRRIREAYRLNRRFLLPALAEKGIAIEMAFLYMDKELQPYTKIEERMRTVLSKIAAKATATEPQGENAGAGVAVDNARSPQ